MHNKSMHPTTTHDLAHLRDLRAALADVPLDYDGARVVVLLNGEVLMCEVSLVVGRCVTLELREVVNACERKGAMVLDEEIAAMAQDKM